MRNCVLTEDDTCREFATPRFIESGWGHAYHVIGEQRTFANGRIFARSIGGKDERNQ